MSDQKVKRQNPEEHGDNSLVNPYQNSMISYDVPGEIVETIFTYLPVKQAARSSVLASRYKNISKYNKSLIFDEEFTRGYQRGTLISIIDNIFRHHEGSKIKSFRLFIAPNEPIIPTIESWIKQAIEKDVEEIELDFSSAGAIPILSSDWVDSGTTLTSLTIDNYEFNPYPLELKNWHLLKSVVLKRVGVSIEFTGALFDCCILLENLELVHCYSLVIMGINATKQKWFRVLKVGDCENLVDLKVKAPSLKTFHYSGEPIFFQFNNVDKLEDMLLTVSSAENITPIRLIGLLLDQFNLKVLSTTGIFVEGLSRIIANKTQKAPRFIFPAMKEYQLLLHDRSFVNLFQIATFLTCCPNLERLFIDLNDFRFVRTSNWERHQKNKLDKFVHDPYRIKFIKISGFKFDEYEIELVLFFLKKTINLENLVLVTSKKDALKIDLNDSCHYRRLFYSSRASKRAQILVYEHSDDAETLYPVHTKTWFHSH